jgi:hypothetical protein
MSSRRFRASATARAWSVAVLLCVGAGLAGLWGIAADRDTAAASAVAVGDVVTLSGGQLRVDRVLAWQDGGHEMPGMTIPDPIPPGQRRFWLYVTMKAADDGPGMAYDRSRFTVAGDGLAATPPHAAADHVGRIRPGALATVILLFQVPAGNHALRLDVRGASQPVELPGGTDPAADHH